MNTKPRYTLKPSDARVIEIPQSVDPEELDSTAPTKPIIVFVFGKGGVGKTQTAQAALIAMREAGHEVIGIDADASNSSLKRQVPQSILLDMGDPSAVIHNLELLIIEHVFQNCRSLVIDTGGGSDKAIRQWFAAPTVQNVYADEGVQIVALTVIDSSLDAASHVMETVDSMPGTKHALVMNLGHTPGTIGERAFQPLMNDPEFRAYVHRMPKIVMPRLPDAVELDTWGARLHTINDKTSPAKHNPFVVGRTKNWLSDMSTALSQIFENSSTIN